MTTAGRSSTPSGTAAPQPPARRCSSSTLTRSTRSAGPRRSPAAFRATRPPLGASHRPAPRPGSIASRRNALALRWLGEYARAAGWDACTPGAATRVRVRHQPSYVFTDDEVRGLFAAIAPQPMSGFSNKAMVDPVLFRVLYGAGLRVSEALSLTLAEVDTRSGTLRIRDSKNGESRTVPLTGRLTAILEGY